MSTSLIETMMVSVIFGLSCYFAILVIKKDCRSLRNVSFGIMSIAIGLWILSAYLSEFFPKSQPLLSTHLSRVAMWAAITFVSSLGIFIYSYYKSNKKWPLWTLSALYLLLSILIFKSPNIISGISVKSYSFDIIYGSLFYTFLIPYALAVILFVIYFFATGYRKLPNQSREQLKNFFIGLSMFISISIIFSLIIPLIIDSDRYYRVSNYSSIFLIGFTAYSISKSKFFDLNTIFSEIISVTVLILLAIRFITSHGKEDYIINGLITVISCGAVYSLMKHISNEAKHKNIIEKNNKKLEQDKHDLMDLDRMKDEFLQMATHELNTPITVIQGKLSMAIEEDMCHLDEEQKGFLKPVLNDTTRLSNLSKDILNTARIDQNRLKINAIDTDLDNLITQIASGFEITAKEHGNSVAYVPVTRPLPKITLDQSKISEVLQNLLSNANKFTENGKILVSAKIQDKYVVVSVSDTGMGINTEDQKHLFQKFYQAGRFDPDNPQEQQGSGLGLYISRSIIELHGGKMWLESTDGKGSTFYFSLPLEYHEVVMPSKLHIDEAKLRVL